MRRVRAVMVGSVCALIAMSVFGQESLRSPSNDVALCSALVYEGQDRDAKSNIEPGIGWEHAHHWCDCVRFRYRAVRSIGNKQEFSHSLSQAVDGCDYVIRAVKPGSRILPKVHVDKGRALKLRGDRSAASWEFRRAIELDLHEVNAYHELSFLLAERGQKTAAQETIMRGLIQNPDSTLLRKRYLELGGTGSIPKPIVSAHPAPDEDRSDVKLEQGAEQEVRPTETVTSVEGLGDTATQDSSNSESSQHEARADEGAQRACRFCPPDEIQQRWIDSFKSGKEMFAE